MTRDRRQLLAGVLGLVAIVVAFAALIWCWRASLNEAVPSDEFQAGIVIAALLVAGLAIAVAAYQWSRRGLMLVTLLAIVLVIAVLIPVGSAQRTEEAAEADRAAATARQKELVELAGKANDAKAAATKKAGDTFVAARDALAAALGSTGAADAEPPTQPELCEDVEGAVDAELCRATLILRPANQAAPKSADLEALQRQLATLLQSSDTTPRQRARVELFAAAATAALSQIKATGAPTEEVATAAEAIRDWCRLAGGSAFYISTPPVTQTCVHRRDTSRTSRQLEILEATAARDVAAVAAKVDGDDKAKVALAEAEAMLASLKAAQKAADAEPVPVADLVSAAGNGLVAALPIGGEGAPPVAFAALGWGVVAAALLFGLRKLAIINAVRGPASVEISEVTALADGTKLLPAFRRHLLANVREPASVPGSTAADGVTDILDASIVSGTLLTSVVKAFRTIFASSATYRVEATYLELAGAKGARAQHEVFLKIVSGRTGELVTSTSVREDTQELALRSAGYRAAAEILVRDQTIPTWAGWSGAASEALAAADDLRERQDEELTDAELETLRGAAAQAPTSGLVLGLYAAALSMDGRLDEALEMELRNVACHPRYPIARYRLIATLSMVADELTLAELIDNAARWRRIVDALTRLEDRSRPRRNGARAWAGLIPSEAHGEGSAIELRRELVALARHLQKAALADVQRRRCVWSSFRRPERRYWFEVLFKADGRESRRRVKALLTSIGRTLVVRQHQLGASALDAARVSEEATATPSSQGALALTADVRALADQHPVGGRDLTEARSRRNRAIRDQADAIEALACSMHDLAQLGDQPVDSATSDSVRHGLEAANASLQELEATATPKRTGRVGRAASVVGARSTAAWRWLARSAQRRRALPERPRPMDLARRYEWWQEAYNDACTLAIDVRGAVDIGGVDRCEGAVMLLERAVELDRAGQLGHAWLSQDPDLAELASVTRFTQLREATRHDAEPTDGDAA